jgi:hypothetical protein
MNIQEEIEGRLKSGRINLPLINLPLIILLTEIFPSVHKYDI